VSAQAPSLADLVAQDATKHGPPCWLCTIPERAEAERLYAASTPLARLERALTKLYPGVCSSAKVSHHFRARHHER
jgi:hypothetical protein